ncbi:hypothetical protein DFS34DRAFT_112610 [Phlyctochytrium arcticum]|nr:hypothetical protein DFS34DRAFT_112610 [Phlyctochytrium arcticum]
MYTLQPFDWDAPTLQPVAAPLPTSVFPFLATATLSSAFVLVSLFLINQVNATKNSRNTLYELVLTFFASTLSGFGLLFLSVAVGLNV